MNSFHILRSLLFVPGSRPELLHKAEASGPDAIVLDLEDSVPPDAKIQARAAVTDALRQRAGRLTFIRINHPTLGMLEQDVITLAAHGSQVVMLPKVESTCDVSALDRRLKEFEQTHGLPDAAIGVMIAIESAIGLRNLYDTLRITPRTRAAPLATAEEGDLMVDIGGEMSPHSAGPPPNPGAIFVDAPAAVPPAPGVGDV